MYDIYSIVFGHYAFDRYIRMKKTPAAICIIFVKFISYKKMISFFVNFILFFIILMHVCWGKVSYVWVKKIRFHVSSIKIVSRLKNLEIHFFLSRNLALKDTFGFDPKNISDNTEKWTFVGEIQPNSITTFTNCVQNT